MAKLTLVTLATVCAVASGVIFTGCRDFIEPDCDSSVTSTEGGCNSVADCVWISFEDIEGSYCRAAGCDTQESSENCETFYNDYGGCTWDAELDFCAQKSFGCDSQTDEQACMLHVSPVGDECEWDSSVSTGKCIDKVGDVTGTPGMPSIVTLPTGPTESVTDFVATCEYDMNEFECEAAGCTFSALPDMQSSCIEPSCFDNQEEQACKDADCVWTTTGCLDDIVTQIPGSGSGSGSGSSIVVPTFKPQFGDECFEFDPSSPDGMTKEECSSKNDCVWIEATEFTMAMCTMKACDQQTTQAACTAFTENPAQTCEWNGNEQFGPKCGIQFTVATVLPDFTTQGPLTDHPFKCGVDTRSECETTDGCEWDEIRDTDAPTLDPTDSTLGGFCQEISCDTRVTENGCNALTDYNCKWSEGVGGFDGFCTTDMGQQSTFTFVAPSTTDSISTDKECTDITSEQECKLEGCKYVDGEKTTPQPPRTTAAKTTAAKTTPAGITCDTSCSPGKCKAGALDAGCTECPSNRMLISGNSQQQYFGQCKPSRECKATKIQNGHTTLNGKKCACDTKHCHFCITKFTDGAFTEVCRRCKDGWYRHDGGCVETCPSNLVGSGSRLIGRECIEPEMCKNGVTVETKQPCVCAFQGATKIQKAPCSICDCQAGGFCEVCHKCNSGMVLNPETSLCEDDCDAAPEGLITYLVGVNGGQCRAPFTCSGGKDEEGDKCKCKISNCLNCDWTSTGASCTRCTNAQYLKEGECVAKSECASPVGVDKEGRECE